MRRWRTRLVLASVLLVSVATLPGAAVAANNGAPSAWYQTGSDQGRDNFNPTERVLTAATVGRLKFSWALPYTDVGQYFTNPAQVVSAQGRTFIGWGPNVDEVNAATGAITQTVQLNQCTYNGLILDVGMLVTPGADCGDKGYYVDVDGYSLATPLSSDGNPVWENADGGITVALGTTAGVTYVAYYDSPYPDRIVALNATTGQELWRLNYSVYEPDFAADSANVYIDGIRSSTGFSARNPKTGAARWGRAGSVIGVAAGHVLAYSTNPAEIVSYSTSGAKQWSTALSGPGGEPLAAETTSELVTLGSNGQLMASSLSKGRLLWQGPVPAAIPATLVIAGGVIYTTSDVYNASTALDTVTLTAQADGSGRKLWSTSQQLSSPGAASLSVADGTVFLSLANTGVFAYRT